MTMLIRKFEQVDGEQVTTLWKVTFPDEPPHNAPSVVMAQKLAYQPELFFVGEMDGHIIGTVLAGYDGHRGWLYSIATDPAYRRLGLGTQLVRHAESALAAIGCIKINLQVRSSNAAVATFYKQLGYAIEERVSMGKRFENTVL
ncbi:MAG: GNAT family acetyltransferase [Burkholderiaceae bacterium]